MRRRQSGAPRIRRNARARSPLTTSQHRTVRRSVLDAIGILIASDVDGRPVVVWTGASYLVAFRYANNAAIWVARVGRDGSIVDGPRVLGASGKPLCALRTAMSVVIGYRGSTLRALMLTRDADIIRDVALPRDSGDASIAWNGSHFAAAWTESTGGKYRLGVVRFDATGVVDGEPRTLDDSYPHQPRIASDGESFAILSSNQPANIGRSGQYLLRHLAADLSDAGTATVFPDAIADEASLLWAGDRGVYAGCLPASKFSLGAWARLAI